MVERYLSRSPPPKAKELASELGVSVRTVYKALYKYRKLRGHGSIRNGSPPPSSNSLDTYLSNADILLEAIYELKASIDRLNESISKLVAVMSSADLNERGQQYPFELPSFVKDNPWLRLIKELPEA